MEKKIVSPSSEDEWGGVRGMVGSPLDPLAVATIPSHKAESGGEELELSDPSTPDWSTPDCDPQHGQGKS